MSDFDQRRQKSHQQFNADRINIQYGVRNHLMDMAKRNSLANKTISRFAGLHLGIDIGIGVTGTIIPGAGLVALVGALAAQIPLVYKPMLLKLVEIYSVPPTMLMDSIIYENITIEGLASLVIPGATAELFVTEVLSELNGSEFLQAILWEAFGEAGWSVAASVLPVVGGIVGASLDALFGATLTWRVGTTAIAFLLNDSQWIGGSREATYKQAKYLVGGLSPQAINRVDLNRVAKIAEIHEKNVQSTLNTITAMRLALESITKEQIRSKLQSMKVPDEVIEEAIGRMK